MFKKRKKPKSGIVWYEFVKTMQKMDVLSTKMFLGEFAHPHFMLLAFNGITQAKNRQLNEFNWDRPSTWLLLIKPK
jgi:hypothetical protein